MASTRDPKFYSELKQLNEDILQLIKETHEKSPYFDFSPTFEDYIRQFNDLEKQFPLPAPSLFSSSVFTGSFAAPSFSFKSYDLPTKPSLLEHHPLTTPTTNEADEDNAAESEDAPPPEPKIDKYEETNVKYSTRCKLYTKTRNEAGTSALMVGLGMLYIKPLESANSIQIVVRQEPDLRRVLLNEVFTSSMPARILTKAVQFILPGSDGAGKIYIAKVRDEEEARALHSHLTFSA